METGAAMAVDMLPSTLPANPDLTIPRVSEIFLPGAALKVIPGTYWAGLAAQM
jgi:hypothetical protein